MSFLIGAREKQIKRLRRRGVFMTVEAVCKLRETALPVCYLDGNLVLGS